MSRSGSLLECQVSVALLFASGIGKAIFEVEELNGIITLKGAVASEEDRLTADALARQQYGVVDVVNSLWTPSFLSDDTVH